MPFGCRNILLICQLYNMVFLDFDVVVDFVLMIIKYYLSIFHQGWNSIFACGHKAGLLPIRNKSVQIFSASTE